MPHSYSKIWVHLVWSTKDRPPYLTKDIKNKVIFHIKEKAKTEGIYVDTVNGVEDHVHCLIDLGLKRSIADTVNLLKGESSHWVNEQALMKFHFNWQIGYGAFSLGESQLDTVRHYILNQEEHHKVKTFVEEFDELLKTYKVAHDDKRP
ncbi:IS200/IS605 family transposase [candidate division TA06 bacterium]|uniref:IS200/IS605 family transposase n=1 Tax=candidate division TA06 bacterium TaxID=2250710 RepID=A0A933I7B6_UNCT6|nr:IS200/IS605 family transposase [candidate division TA06 bacterium]